MGSKNSKNTLKQNSKKIDNNKKTIGKKIGKTIGKTIDKSNIKEYVEEMLNNPEINIYGFPDAIERQIYTNTITLLLHILENALQNTEIHLFNHRIVFDIQPLSELPKSNPTNPTTTPTNNDPKLIITPIITNNF